MQNKELEKAGFNFDNSKRNDHLFQSGLSPPTLDRIGTTIVGIVYKDGVILGADKRSTSGTIVSDKNCSKIYYLEKNIYCSGAGVAVDTMMITTMISAQCKLHRLNTGREVPVVAANSMLKHVLYRYQGKIEAAFLLGGVDRTGGHIYSILNDGASDKLPYATLGSGSLAAMSIFEDRWKHDMNEEEGKKLVRDAVAAGILNDLGSGSNIDLCVITKDGANLLRNYECIGKKGKRLLDNTLAEGTTPVLHTTIEQFDMDEEIEDFPMEIE